MVSSLIFIGSDHLKNKSLEILNSEFALSNNYFDLIASIGRKDYSSIINNVEKIVCEINLDPLNYDHNLLDKRLNDIWDNAEVQLNSWEPFIITTANDKNGNVENFTKELLVNIQSSVKTSNIESITDLYIKSLFPNFKPDPVPVSFQEPNISDFEKNINKNYSPLLLLSSNKIDLNIDKFKKVEEEFENSKKEIFQKFTKIIIDALYYKNFNKLRDIQEIESFLVNKNLLEKKNKVENLRQVLDKLYSLYSSWIKFFPSVFEEPAFFKKTTVFRSKFFSQLLRIFENNIEQLNLEQVNFPLYGSFNFINVALENQLKMCQKLRKHNKNNFYILDSQMKDTLDCIFNETINNNNQSNFCI